MPHDRSILPIEPFTPEQRRSLNAFLRNALGLCAHENGVMSDFVVRRVGTGETVADANVYCKDCDARYTLFAVPIQWPEKPNAT